MVGRFNIFSGNAWASARLAGGFRGGTATPRAISVAHEERRRRAGTRAGSVVAEKTAMRMVVGDAEQAAAADNATGEATLTCWGHRTLTKFVKSSEKYHLPLFICTSDPQ